MIWCAKAGIISTGRVMSSIPKIVGTFSADEKLFEASSPGSSFDRVATEIEMLFSQLASEGGLFIMIGQKV